MELPTRLFVYLSSSPFPSEMACFSELSTIAIKASIWPIISFFIKSLLCPTHILPMIRTRITSDPRRGPLQGYPSIDSQEKILNIVVVLEWLDNLKVPSQETKGCFLFIHCVIRLLRSIPSTSSSVSDGSSSSGSSPVNIRRCVLRAAFNSELRMSSESLSCCNFAIIRGGGGS